MRFFLALICTSSMYAGLVGWQSLRSLIGRADLILVGTVIDGSWADDGSVARFTLNPERVLSGDPATAGASIQVVWRDDLPSGGLSGNSRSTPLARARGLWFLRKAAPGGWELLPALVGDVRFENTCIEVPAGEIQKEYEYTKPASTEDKVASEIGAAIEANRGEYFQHSRFHSGLLDELQSPVVQRLYTRLASSTSARQRILGLAGLIRQGQVTALAEVEEGAASFAGLPEAGVLLRSIESDFRISDATAVSTLSQIAITQAPTLPGLRLAAARALSAIHTKDALPYLARLLDDPDSALRIEGVGGIASFAVGLPVQTTANVPSLGYLQRQDGWPYTNPDTVAHFAMGEQAIKKDEAGYISYWKGWWLQHRDEILSH